MKRLALRLPGLVLVGVLLTSCGGDHEASTAPPTSSEVGSAPSPLDRMRGAQKPATLVGLVGLARSHMDAVDALGPSYQGPADAHLGRATVELVEMILMLEIVRTAKREIRTALEPNSRLMLGTFHLPLAEWLHERERGEGTEALDTPLGRIPADTRDVHDAFMRLILEREDPELAKRLATGELRSAMGQLFSVCQIGWAGCPDGALGFLPEQGASIDMKTWWEEMPQLIAEFMARWGDLWMCEDALDDLHARFEPSTERFDELSRSVLGTTVEESVDAWWDGKVDDALAPWREHVAKHVPERLDVLRELSRVLQKGRLMRLAEDVSGALWRLESGELSLAALGEDESIRPYAFSALDGGYVAVPRHYPHVGRMAYLCDGRGSLWSKDVRGEEVASVPGDPEAEGWTLKHDEEDPPPRFVLPGESGEHEK